VLPSLTQLLPFAAAIRIAPVEKALAIYVRKSKILSSAQVSSHSLSDEVTINAKTLFHQGWTVNADGFILIHSHPSGSVEPSLNDLRATEYLADMADMLELPLLDHMIVTLTEHFSFRTAGLLSD